MTKGILLSATIVVGLLLAIQVAVFAQSPTQTAVSPSPAVTVPSGAPATGRGI